MESTDEVRNMLKEQARREIAEYERELQKAECGNSPTILPRSEANIRLRKILARELIRPAAKGFVFEGFKGLNNMTNRELSERVSDDPPVLDCMVWDDVAFYLLFGNRRQADDTVLAKMGLYDCPCIEEEEDGEEVEE